MIARPAAAQFVWKDPTTGVWSNSANWTGGVPASSATTSLTFNSANGGAAYTATNDISDPFDLNSLTLDNLNPTGGTGLITVAEMSSIASTGLNFTGSAPTINFNGTGDATISSPLSLLATTTIAGTGSGLLTFTGVINGNTTQATDLVVNDAAGSVAFNANTTLQQLSNSTGGDFYAQNGAVSINNVQFTTNDLAYVGDAASSVSTGLGTGANATLTINDANYTQYGRFSIAGFNGDVGVVNVTNGGGLNVYNGTGSNAFGARFQLGGQGANYVGGTQVYGTVVNTTGSAALNISGGSIVNVDQPIFVYENGSISISGYNAANAPTNPPYGTPSMLNVASIDDGNAPSSGIGGTKLSNGGQLNLLGQDAGAVVTYSGVFSGSGGEIQMDGDYIQVFAGNSASFGGELQLTSGEVSIGTATAPSATMSGLTSVEFAGADTTANLTVYGTVGTALTDLQTGTINVLGTYNSTTMTIDSGTATVSGTGTLTSSTLNVNNGTLTLSGTGTSTGTATTVSQGTLNVGSTATLAGSTLAINSGGSVNDAGTIGASTITVGSGTLSVTGSTPTTGTVTVGTGGVLAGNGSVGNIALTAGAVSPGAVLGTNGVGSVANLSGHSLTWTGGAALWLDLNLSSTSSDELNLTSFFDSANGSPSAADGYDVDFSTLGTFGGTPETFNLVTFQAGQTNFTAKDFTAVNLPSNLQGAFTINSADNTLEFTVSGVLPEPSSLLLFAPAGAAAITGLRALRRRRAAS